MSQFEHVEIFYAVHNHSSDVTSTKHDQPPKTPRHEHVARTRWSRLLQPVQNVQAVQCLAAVQKFQRSRFKVRLTQRRNFHVSGILETSKYKLTRAWR